MTEHNIEIEVSDYGPINSASIDLRPMTVFLGQSNTGKTFMSVLICALAKYYSNGLAFPATLPFVAGHMQQLRKGKGSNMAETDKLLDAFISELQQKLKGHKEGNITLEEDIVALIPGMLERHGNDFFNEVKRCFGFENAGSLISKWSKDRKSSFTVKRGTPESKGGFLQELALKASNGKLATQFDVKSLKAGHVSPSPFHHALFFEMLGMPSADADFRRDLILSLLLQEITHECVSPLNLPTYYLPPDRTGIMHAQRAIASSFVASAPYAGAGIIRAQNFPTLSGVVSDFLVQLIQLDERTNDYGIDFAKRIEDEILKGTVEIDQSANAFPEFFYRPGNWPKKAGRLPLMQASSMVTELAPLVLFLRHLIKEDSILIVEEPGAHLHPEMQVELIKHLADMSNHGIKVIITTHSSWVIEELSNLISKSKTSRGQRAIPADGSFSSDSVTLKPEDVGTWFFSPDPHRKGSTVAKIECDEEGIYPSGFEDVAENLHNEWANIAREVEEIS